MKPTRLADAFEDAERVMNASDVYVLPHPPAVSAAHGPRVRLRGKARLIARQFGRRRSQLARQVAATAGTDILMVALGGLGGILLARGLGPTDRGRLVAVIQWPVLIGALASLGLTEAITYHVSRSRTQDQADGFVSSGTIACALTGLSVAAIAWPVAIQLGRNSDVQLYLFIVLLLTPAYIVGGFWNSALQAVDIPSFNITRAIQPVTYFVAIAALAFSGYMDLSSVVVVLVITQIVMLAVTYALTRRRFNAHVRGLLQYLRSLYSYGIRAFLAFTPRTINLQLDLLLLSVVSWISAASLGNYAVAASISRLVLPFTLAFGTVGFPALAKATDARAKRRIQKTALLGALGTSTMIASVVTLATFWFVPFVFGSGFAPAVKALWLLAPGSVCLAVSNVAGDLLRGWGSPLRAALGEATGAVVTVLGLLVFAPRYGIYAASIVSSVAYATAMIALLLLLRSRATTIRSRVSEPSSLRPTTIRWQASEPSS